MASYLGFGIKFVLLAYKVKVLIRLSLFGIQLTGPMPIMLWIAAIIEVIIGNYGDMGILLAIQFINAGISFYETTKVGQHE